VIRSSESIVALAAALVAAQAEMPGVPKETKGQVGSQVRYYADLATVVEVVRPVLAKHGLAYVQLPADSDPGKVAVTTRLIHKTGEWLEDTLSMPAGNNGAQGVGSAITYARRYSLMAMLGLAPEDDDGGAASQPAPRQAPRPPRPAAAAPSPEQDASNPAAVTDPQIKKLQVLANEKGFANRDARLAMWCAFIGRQVTTATQLTKTEAHMLIEHMDAMPSPTEEG
jgi:hypothetical protein